MSAFKSTQTQWEFTLVVFISLALPPALFSQIVVGKISRPNSRPYAVAVYEAGNKIFVADDATGNLLTYDGNTHSEINSVTIGAKVSSMIVHEASAKLYALSFDAKKIAVINAKTGALLKHLPGKYPTGFTFLGSGSLALDDNLGKVYAFLSGDTVAQIDIVTDSITPIALSQASSVFFTVMAVNPATHELFISRTQSNAASSFLEIINGNTMQKTSVTGIGGGAFGIGVNWIENKIYVSTGGGVGVPFRVLHRNTNTVKTIPADNDATAFFFDAAKNFVYTSSEVNAITTIIDGAADSFFNFPMASSTIAAASRQATGHLYYTSTNFTGMLDRETQVLEMIPVDNPNVGGVIIQWIAINQTTGRVYTINDSRLNFVTVIQDTEDLVHPPIYLGGGTQGLKVLDPISRGITDRWARGGGVNGMAIRPGGGRVYAPAGFSLYVYAGSGSSSLLHSINVGTGLAVPVVSPDGKKVYATADAASKVVVIDLENQKILTEIPVSSVPWGAAMTPDGAKVYVGSRGLESVISVIEVASNTVKKKIQLSTPPAFQSTWPWGVAINPSGTKVYVANNLANTVAVINTTTDAVIKTIAVGEQPRWITITPDGKHIYVSNSRSGTVSIIDSGTDAVIKTVTVGTDPQGLGALPDGSAVFVVNQNTPAASTLSVINTVDFSVVTTPLPESGIRSLAVADPTAKITGRVVRGDTPVAGATLRALQAGVQKATATTNDAGDYSIFNLKPGMYDIEVSAPNTPAKIAPGKTVDRGQTTIVNFNLEATSVHGNEVTVRKFRLSQNHPNPFNPATTIHYEIPKRSQVVLSIFDVLGNKIAELVNAVKEAGQYEIKWEPVTVKTGVYFYRLHAGDWVETKKLVLIR